MIISLQIIREQLYSEVTTKIYGNATGVAYCIRYSRPTLKNFSILSRTFCRIFEQIFLLDSVRKPKYSWQETIVSKSVTVNHNTARN